MMVTGGGFTKTYNRKRESVVGKPLLCRNMQILEYGSKVRDMIYGERGTHFNKSTFNWSMAAVLGSCEFDGDEDKGWWWG
jgi:hypothetical protein